MASFVYSFTAGIVCTLKTYQMWFLVRKYNE